MNPRNQYTPGDIRKMQKDAIQRVQNMQNRERKTVENFNKILNHKPPDKEETKNKDKDVKDEITPLSIQDSVSKKENKNVNLGFNNFIDLILKDQEKALLTILILLLLSENENPLIILALIYILT